MSVDIDVTPDMLLLIQQKLCIVQYRYGILFFYLYIKPNPNPNSNSVKYDSVWIVEYVQNNI